MFKAKAGFQMSVARKAGFSLGDYACNLYWQSVSLFLMFYYTDALGLSGATAGLIYMVASIFDGVTDPIMGALADRTRTRWGRFRPYLLLGSAPLGLSFCFLYWSPAATGLGLTAVVLASHLVFRLAYTAVSVPYGSLTARMTQSSTERSSLAGFRMVAATLAGMTVSFLTQPMVDRFGGGDLATGFFYAAVVFALIATGIFPLVFLATREPPEPPGEPVRLSLADCWRAMGKNKAFWIVMVAISLGAMSSTALSKSLLYYMKYIAEDEAAARYALSIKAALGIAIIPAWVIATRFIGKQAAWLTAAGWGLVCAIGLLVFDVQTALAVTIFYMVIHVASLGVSTTYWSMVPDTVEYGEWKSGARAESFTFGLAMFFQKVALGLAAAFFGWALDVIGYVPNVQQTPQTLEGLKMVVIAFPLIGLGGSAIAMLFYPLRRGVHEKIVDDLAERKLAATP
ncbi:MAG: glycoside-pentoside-hexuronide (GPH):cation symporter [Phenylobacterium sp.]|nr:glycoside-pentoside-hexuronide (GPH):cation symporter [Phenylobacterium sp.]